MLCPATWTLILSGWRPGTPVGCFSSDEFSAGCDGNYTEDSATVNYGTGAVELDDLIFRRTSFLPHELSAG